MAYLSQDHGLGLSSEIFRLTFSLTMPLLIERPLPLTVLILTVLISHQASFFIMKAIAAASPFDIQVEKLLASTRARSKELRSPARFYEGRGTQSASAKRVAWAFLFFNALFPFVLGFAIYTLWRSTKLLMFRAYQQAGLYPSILALRAHTSGVKHLIPGPILYSVPDALWVYGATAALGYLWLSHPGRYKRLFWTLLPVSIGVGSEFGQLFRLVPGTFDWMDVSCYVVAGTLAAASIYFFAGSGAGLRFGFWSRLSKRTPQSTLNVSKYAPRRPETAAMQKQNSSPQSMRRGHLQASKSIGPGAEPARANLEVATLTLESQHANRI
jgi:hypothetical protein